MTSLRCDLTMCFAVQALKAVRTMTILRTVRKAKLCRMRESF